MFQGVTKVAKGGARFGQLPAKFFNWDLSWG